MIPHQRLRQQRDRLIAASGQISQQRGEGDARLRIVGAMGQHIAINLFRILQARRLIGSDVGRTISCSFEASPISML